MATAPESSRLRLPVFLSNGITRAYALVVGLTLACAALAYAGLEDEPVRAAQGTDAGLLAPARPRIPGSLKLPPPSQLKVDFRALPATERDDMIEVTADGQRLP